MSVHVDFIMGGLHVVVGHLNISSVNSSGSERSDMRGQHLPELMINDQTHSCSSTYSEKGGLC